jgi:hypothetical protein
MQVLKKIKRGLLCFFVFSASSAALAIPYSAQVADSNLIDESLSDSLPLAFMPFALRTEDFKVEVDNPEILKAKVEISLVANSVQWSRVEDMFVLPRSLLQVKTPVGVTGILRANVAVTPLLLKEDGSYWAQTLVSLVQTPLSELMLEINDHGRLIRSKMRLVPVKSGIPGPIVFDVSCSRRPLEVTESHIPSGQWVYIACRPLEVAKEGSLAQTQEFYILWSGKSSPLVVNGQSLTSLNSEGLGLWEVMAPPGATTWNIRHDLQGSEGFNLKSFASEEIHHGVFAVGLGPYNMYFNGGGQSYNGISELTSLYGSYLLSEFSRVIYFAEVAATPQLFSDYGLYIEFESSRILDRRLSFNLLLGIHGAAFFASSNYTGTNLSYNGHVDGPQGFELVYTDPHLPMQSISTGAFIEPSINVNSYYNVWLRWSFAKYFVEINYINWVQNLDQLYQSSATGITVGTPIFRFW